MIDYNSNSMLSSPHLIFFLFVVYNNINDSQQRVVGSQHKKRKGQDDEGRDRERDGCWSGPARKWNQRKKVCLKRAYTLVVEKHGEKAKFRRFFFSLFGRIRTAKKVGECEGKPTHTSKLCRHRQQRKERRGKRLVEADGRKKKKPITYYIKSIFSR